MSCCKCGSEPKPGAKEGIVIRQTDLINEFSDLLIGEDVIQGSMNWSIVFLQTTSTFCARCPEQWYGYSPYAGNPATAALDVLFRQAIDNEWQDNCRCKPVCDPPRGGNCSTIYTIWLSYTFQSRLLDGSWENRTVSRGGNSNHYGPIRALRIVEQTSTAPSSAGCQSFALFADLGIPGKTQGNDRERNNIFIARTVFEGCDGTRNVGNIQPGFERLDRQPDTCPQPLEPPQPPPLIHNPPMIIPPPPPPDPCNCKDRIVFRDRIVEKIKIVEKIVTKCCDLSPILKRIDKLEGSIKVMLAAQTVAQGVALAAGLKIQTAAVVAANKAALGVQTAAILSAIKAALLLQTKSILVSVSGFITTSTATTKAALLLQTKTIVASLSTVIAKATAALKAGILLQSKTLTGLVIAAISTSTGTIASLLAIAEDSIISRVVEGVRKRIYTAEMILMDKITQSNDNVLRQVVSRIGQAENKIVSGIISGVRNPIIQHIAKTATSIINTLRQDIRASENRITSTIQREANITRAAIATAIAAAVAGLTALILKQTAAILVLLTQLSAAVTAGFAFMKTKLLSMSTTLGQILKDLNLIQRDLSNVQRTAQQIDQKVSVNVSGEVDLTPCNGNRNQERFNGQGLSGLSSQIRALTRLLGLVKREVCEIEITPSAPVEIEVPIFDRCLNEEAQFTSLRLQVDPSDRTSTLQMFNRLAQIEAQQCKRKNDDAIAAIPDWWQIRLGADIPQLVIQYAERLGDGSYGSPKYSVSIPHYRKTFEQTVKEDFPSYTKGSRMGVLICSDNSKLIVNALDEDEVDRVMTQLMSLIDSTFIQDARINNGARRGSNLKEILVYPRIAKYFATGQKDTKPTWIKYFYED